MKVYSERDTHTFWEHKITSNCWRNVSVQETQKLLTSLTERQSWIELRVVCE